MRTSAPAWSALAVLLAGYAAIAVVAGARESPLTVLLPQGARPPAWSTGLARAAGVYGLGRHRLVPVAWLLVLALIAAYAVVLVEARRGRIGLPVALAASAVAIAVAVAAPLLLSRDVYTYAAWGRHGDVYTVPLSAFARDPFAQAASEQWKGTHSVYGPLFTLVSAGLVRVTRSPAGTILAFKLLAGVALAAATGLAALAARRLRPGRAPLAVALVGLDPVLVVHTVGGGHVDALIAALVAGAAVLAARRPPRLSARALAITALLAAACLVKIVVAPVLVLWLWWAGRPARTLAAHAALAAGLAAALVAPYGTPAALASLGGVEAWASPSHLVGSLLAPRPAEAAFLALFAVLAVRVARGLDRDDAAALPAAWAVLLLLLALSLPYLLPWYAAWFAPLLALVEDGAVVLAGATAALVLATTLIPADPFHGRTSSTVMDEVHLGAASALLLLLAVLAWRVGGLAARRAPSRIPG